MEHGKPLQEGVRVKLPPGLTWEQLAAMSPDEIRERGLWPKGFLPLPHPFHPTGGLVFPKEEIDALKRQDGRDLTRFDIDFDLPERFLPAFPPAMYLASRPDLGDVSQGKLVSLTNYFELFNGILTPRQLEGLRLLLTPFPQQQFNATDDRKSAIPSQGVACFDCHANGHQNGAMHLARCPAGVVPPSHRDRVAARRQYPAAVRLAACPEDDRGFHRVRAAHRLFRRRHRDRHEEGRESARARQPGRLHGRLRGDAGLPAGAEARRVWQARSGQGDASRNAWTGDLLRQGAMRELPSAALLHRQPDARPQDGALLQSRKWSTTR